MKFHHLFWLVVSAGLLLSTAWAVQMVMKNGDRVTGTIIKQDGKTITVKTDNFGIVTAPWDKVASLKSDQPVNVVLKDGKTLVGTVAPSEGKVGITTKDTKVDVSPGEVAAMTTDKISLDFNLIKASALINGQTASPRLFVNFFNDYEYDRFQNLDLRFVIGGGFGLHAVKNKRSALNLLGGGSMAC